LINTRPPRTYPEGREFEQWMYNLYRKLGLSDVVFDDLVNIIPATTVVNETNYNQSPVVGISLEYARGDHTHGTPPSVTLSNTLAIAYAITLG
jgi:hypothetical protein